MSERMDFRTYRQRLADLARQYDAEPASDGSAAAIERDLLYFVRLIALARIALRDETGT